MQVACEDHNRKCEDEHSPPEHDNEIYGDEIFALSIIPDLVEACESHRHHPLISFNLEDVLRAVCALHSAMQIVEHESEGRGDVENGDTGANEKLPQHLLESRMRRKERGNLSTIKQQVRIQSPDPDPDPDPNAYLNLDRN